jgi:proteasome lid subunit RPN8/RPN11
VDGDIQFGEVQQARPRQRRRPDCDRHFAVCPCGSPAADDLPIFIDMDVLAEIEAHARSNSSVELGGVLLGGQFEDLCGNPFVLVLDSLRAEHYESSGSHFKFTHDTWTQITRQRDQFSDEMQMVGWYHTHPNLGVFLSGMDRFICEHFFNCPLDVALVVDPLRGDRGWFYWGGDGGRRLPRAQGFSVTASRFRRPELHNFARLLQGDATMTTERLPGGPPPGADLRLPQQVIHTIRPQLGWIGAAVLAMLVLQLCITLLVALRIGPPASAGRPAAADTLPPGQEPAAELALREHRLAAREAVFHELLGHVEVEADGHLNVDSLVDRYKRLRQQADQQTKTALLLDQAAEWIEQDRKELQAKLRELQESKQELAAGNKQLLARIDELQNLREADQQAAQERIAQLEKQLGEATEEDLEQDSATWIESWTTIVAALVGLAIVGVLAAVILARRARRRRVS